MPDFIGQAMRVLGALPLGDPAELEAYARRLEMASETFESGNAQFRQAIDSAGLHQGPYAARLKLSANLFSDASRRELTVETRRLANDVRSQAAQLRSEQHQWKTELRRMAARLEREFLEKGKA